MVYPPTGSTAYEREMSTPPTLLLDMALVYHAMANWRCPICLSVLKRVLFGHRPDWPSGVAVSGRSAAGPVMSVPDVLMVAEAYRVGRTDLLSNYDSESGLVHRCCPSVRLFVCLSVCRQNAKRRFSQKN